MTTKLDVSLCMPLEKYFIQCVLLGILKNSIVPKAKLLFPVPYCCDLSMFRKMNDLYTRLWFNIRTVFSKLSKHCRLCKLNIKAATFVF